ncbi:MAG: S41 family peptidase [Terriglobales bacterium]
MRTKFVQHSGLVSGTNALYDYSINQGQLDAKLYKPRWTTAGGVFVWKLPNFHFDPSDAQNLLDRAKKYSGLVLDLRRNPGGLVEDEKQLLGYFLNHDVTVMTRQGRRHAGPARASTNRDHYAGNLVVVVVDSGSASAAEIFARTVQLEHLGTVIGDTTPGAVMEAEHFPMQFGDMNIGSATFCGASITVDDLIMPDGHSLEKVGDTPDVIALPTAADLAAGRDTVLAQAVKLAGGAGDTAALAQAFPMICPPYNSGAN